MEAQTDRTEPGSREELPHDAWETREFAFVTLWGGKETGGKTLDWLAQAEIPPRSVLYWLDNSGGKFSDRLRHEWELRLKQRFRKLIWIDGGEPYRPAAVEFALNPGRHRHVANLYNQIFLSVFEELIVTLEDDMVPPLRGVRALVNLLERLPRIGLVSGVYRNRINPSSICAALDKQAWQKVPFYDDLPPRPFEVGMSGGGFALLSNRALQQALPLRCESDRPGHLVGWDGNLGKDLTSLGYRLVVHPGVRCAHLCPEVIAYEAARTGAT